MLQQFFSQMLQLQILLVQRLHSQVGYLKLLQMLQLQILVSKVLNKRNWTFIDYQNSHMLKCLMLQHNKY